MILTPVIGWPESHHFEGDIVIDMGDGAWNVGNADDGCPHSDAAPVVYCWNESGHNFTTVCAECILEALDEIGYKRKGTT